jgi:hypothetical protein
VLMCPMWFMITISGTFRRNLFDPYELLLKYIQALSDCSPQTFPLSRLLTIWWASHIDTVIMATNSFGANTTALEVAQAFKDHIRGKNGG